jgi:hypothetical protein
VPKTKKTSQSGGYWISRRELLMTPEQQFSIMTSGTVVTYKDQEGLERRLVSKGAVGLVKWIKPNDRLPKDFPRVSMQVEFEAEDGYILRLPIDAFRLPGVELLKVEKVENEI